MTFSLDKALSAISARVTDDQRDQQTALNQAGRTNLAQNSFANRVATAHAQELAVRATINGLKALPDSDLKQTRLMNALDRLSELLAEQGLYQAAIDVTPNEARRAVYQQSLDAIELHDGETCGCPAENVLDRKTNTTFKQPAMQTLGQIPSLAHNRLVTLKVCRHCNVASVA